MANSETFLGVAKAPQTNEDTIKGLTDSAKSLGSHALISAETSTLSSWRYHLVIAASLVALPGPFYGFVDLECQLFVYRTPVHTDSAR